MKFYITHEGQYFKELWQELGSALWVSNASEAVVYEDYSTAFRAACEVQAITETAVNVACVG